MPAAPPSWVTVSVPKVGNRPEENEDAAAADPELLRFAVADGATEAWQSGAWASRLADAYIRRPPTPTDFPAWLATVRQWESPPVPGGGSWYAELKQEQGSFATLLGLELRRPKEGAGMAWRAVAIGDSCLLVVRGGRVETAFPIASVDGFGNRPALVPSSLTTACPEPEWLAGRAEPGDVLVLATDALARHLLGLTERRAWEPILVAVTADSTDRDPLLKWLSARRPLLNDDATALVVRVPARPEPTA